MIKSNKKKMKGGGSEPDLQELKQAYKEAKKAWEANRSDEHLLQAYKQHKLRYKQELASRGKASADSDRAASAETEGGGAETFPASQEQHMKLAETVAASGEQLVQLQENFQILRKEFDAFRATTEFKEMGREELLSNAADRINIDSIEIDGKYAADYYHEPPTESELEQYETDLELMSPQQPVRGAKGEARKTAVKKLYGVYKVLIENDNTDGTLKANFLLLIKIANYELKNT